MSLKKKRNKKALRLFSKLTVLLFIFVIFAQLAKVAWFFELFTHFAFQYLLIGMLFFLLLVMQKRNVMALVALAVVLVNLFAIIPMLPKKTKDQKGFEQVNILQFNVNRFNKNREEIVKYLNEKSNEADIVVLFEVNDKWAKQLEAIQWLYPYNVRKNIRGDRDIAIFSKLAVTEFEIVEPEKDSNSVSYVVVRGITDIGNKNFVIYALHPPPPMSPKAAAVRNNTLISAARQLAGEKAPFRMVVADMNTTVYSPYFTAFTNISGLIDSDQGRGFFMTWPSILPSPLGIAIDHVLVSQNIEVLDRKTGPSMGSDHLPVITSLSLIEPGTPAVPENVASDHNEKPAAEVQDQQKSLNNNVVKE